MARYVWLYLAASTSIRLLSVFFCLRMSVVGEVTTSVDDDSSVVRVECICEYSAP